ncbi:bacteriocin-associated integral membrane family protein [Streptomyces sp. NPDC090021]|uniref:bacteriocin-associated integral membrane family protein n=1 Tax=Streptomyces sp. NPDC090021 TaxID=3365919 RepID=UPI0038094463
MLHRGIKFIYAAVLAFSAVVSFLFVRGLDEDWVLGHSAVVWVLDSDDSTSGSQVAGDLASFAADHKVSVAREVPDLKDPDGRRHLYLASGIPDSDAASWLDEGYPAFGRDYRTEVHPLAEIGQRDPRGFYYVFGPPEAADALVAEFARLGLQASVQHPLSPAELAPYYADGTLALALGVVALAAVTMTGASVLLNAKTYGVLRLQGRSFAEILLRDLRQLAAFGAIAAGAVAAGVLALLGLYNGLAWIGLFASVTAAIAGLLVLLMLATHAAVLALTFKTDVLPALKGELPARAASVSAYLVRVPALLLALSIATSVVAAGQDILSRQESRDVYAKVGETSAIRLNGSLGEDDTKVMEERVGRWLRQSDAAGKLIVAGRRELRDIAPRSGLPQGEMLIVNETFLAQQPFFDPAGRRYTPAPQDGKGPDAHAVRVLVPESLGRHASAIAAEIPGTLSPAQPERIRPDQVQTLTAKSGQRVFGYSSGDQAHTAARNIKEDRSLVSDPVLVVVPNGSRFLTDNAYTSFATQGGVVFPAPSHIQAGIEANKLQDEVIAIRPVGQNAALQMRDALNDFRLHLFNLAVAVAVLVITGIGVCIVYSRKNAQAIFVKHISGWRFAASHRSVLAVEGVLAVLLAGWVPFDVWQQNQELKEYTALGIPAPSEPAQITALDLGLTAGLVAFEAGAVLLALMVFHRRIVKEGATEG